MRRHIVPWMFATLVVVVVAVAPVFAAQRYEGTVMSAENWRLSIQQMDRNELTFDVARDAMILRDGKQVRLEKIKRGDQAIVAVENRGDKLLATMIEVRTGH